MLFYHGFLDASSVIYGAALGIPTYLAFHRKIRVVMWGHLYSTGAEERIKKWRESITLLAVEMVSDANQGFVYTK